MTDRSPALALPDWLRPELQRLQQTAHSAVLLGGPGGAGQLALAYHLAAAWLCDAPTEHGMCGACPSCGNLQAQSHADLCVLVPESVSVATGLMLAPRAQMAWESKDAKPSQRIRVEAALEAVEFAQRTQSRQKGRVVLVYPAEGLNTEAANTLLKTLEEPPPNLRFVLATEQLTAVLPTVRSRCQLQTLAWPDAQGVQQWLAQQHPKASAADHEACWHAAGGLPEKAAALLAAGLNAKTCQGLPSALAQGQGGGVERFAGPELVDLLQKVAHDALAVVSGAAPRFFVQAEWPTGMRAMALQQWAKQLVDDRRHAGHPFQASLMLDAHLAMAQRALHSAAKP
jgi:DNA polymerase-3 subunit delta'